MTAVTEPQAAPAPPRPVKGHTVWFVTATGPVIWMVHLAGSAVLVPLQCRLNTSWMVNALTVITSLVILASIVVGDVLRRRAHRAGQDTSTLSLAFIALVGQAWGVISLVVTVLEGLPNTVLNSCPK